VAEFRKSLGLGCCEGSYVKQLAVCWLTEMVGPGVLECFRPHIILQDVDRTADLLAGLGLTTYLLHCVLIVRIRTVMQPSPAAWKPRFPF
jgi:hypothetical protein